MARSPCSQGVRPPECLGKRSLRALSLVGGRIGCIDSHGKPREFGDALFDGHLFVFLGRRLDSCNILFWNTGGLVLYYKRLERGRFQPPKISPDGKALELDMVALTILLDGIDLRSGGRQRSGNR